MPELVDDVLELLTPWPSANALAREIGFDSATSAATAAQLAVPLIVAGMVHRLNDPDESAALIEIVREVDTAGLHDFGSTLTDRKYEPTGSEAVVRILGDKHKAVAIKLAPEAECPETSAINVFPPMAWAVTGLIVKRNGREHNRHSLLQIIRNEHDGLLRTGWGEWMSAVAPETQPASEVAVDDAPFDSSTSGEPVADAPLVDEFAPDGEQGAAEESSSRYPPPMSRTSRVGDEDDLDGAVVTEEADGSTTEDLPDLEIDDDESSEFTATKELAPEDVPAWSVDGVEVTDGTDLGNSDVTIQLDEETRAELAAELRQGVFTDDADDAELLDAADGNDDDVIDVVEVVDGVETADIVDEAHGAEVVGADADVVEAVADDVEGFEDLDGVEPAVGVEPTDPSDELEQPEVDPEDVAVDHDVDAATGADGASAVESLGDEPSQPVAAPALDAPVSPDDPHLLEHLEQAIAELEADDGFDPMETVSYENRPSEVDLEAVLRDAVPEAEIPPVRRQMPMLPSAESLPPLAPGGELSDYLPPGAAMPQTDQPAARTASSGGLGLTDFGPQQGSSGGQDWVEERELGSTRSMWFAAFVGLLLIGGAVLWFLTEDNIDSTLGAGETATTTALPIAEADNDGAADAAEPVSFDLVFAGEADSVTAMATLTFDSADQQLCYGVQATGLGSAPSGEFGRGVAGARTPIVDLGLAAADDEGCLPMSRDVITSVLADPSGHYLVLADDNVNIRSQLTE